MKLRVGHAEKRQGREAYSSIQAKAEVEFDLPDDATPDDAIAALMKWRLVVEEHVQGALQPEASTQAIVCSREPLQTGSGRVGAGGERPDPGAGHEHPDYPQGQAMKAIDRKCSKCKKPIPAWGWNYSIRTHGRPLCKNCPT